MELFLKTIVIKIVEAICLCNLKIIRGIFGKNRYYYSVVFK